MGIYDIIAIEYPQLPHGNYQTYVNIWEPVSYGDFYRIDAEGQIWRLTDNACMNPERGVLSPPQKLDYTDPALVVYLDGPANAPTDVPDAFFLTFKHGMLTGWRVHFESRVGYIDSPIDDP